MIYSIPKRLEIFQKRLYSEKEKTNTTIAKITINK